MEPKVKPWRTRKRNPKWNTKETLNGTQTETLKNPQTKPQMKH